MHHSQLLALALCDLLVDGLGEARAYLIRRQPKLKAYRIRCGPE